MENKQLIQRRSVIWVIGFCIAVALVTAVFGGLRLRPMGAGSWRVLLPAIVLALTMFLGLLWQSRVRAALRWNAVLNDYAEREIARARRRGGSLATLEADERNGDSVQALKDRLAGELLDLSYPVVFRQGIQGASVDVELAIWHTIDDTLRDMLQPLLAEADRTPPTCDFVLARLTKGVYQAARRFGFRGSFADVEFGLWDAFHARRCRRYCIDLLQALFRRSRGVLETQQTRPPTEHV
jgi:hypothetical protein